MTLAVMRAPASPGRALDVVENVTDAAWDAYVAGRPDASAYHYAGWGRLIGRAFGHETRMLSARRGSTIEGVLPLVVMKSRLFGRFVVSLPFVNAGGVLADNDEAASALVDGAVRIAEGASADCLELRHTARRFPALSERRHKVAMALALAPSVESQWQALDRKIRNQVRKAEKGALTASSGGAELIPAFYEVFARNMRDLGTPVFGRRLFEEVFQTFPDNTTLVCVRSGDRPVAASVVHWRGDWMEVPWASALREFNAQCANTLLYWQMLQLAVARGCRTFEFGRCTPGEGTYRFKEQWGACPAPLVWEYWTPAGRSAPSVSPHDSRYGLAVSVWQRLPVRVTSLVGPRIVRGIPC